jgi:hypothetical protein
MTKEIKVYICDLADVDSLLNPKHFNFKELEKKKKYKEIMAHAELHGTIYSLQGFQNAINNEELDLGNAFILIK